MVFQLGSALLDACVLATLNRGDAYGYVLTQTVKSVVEVSESTLDRKSTRLNSSNSDTSRMP